jgi:hypothetical protein
MEVDAVKELFWKGREIAMKAVRDGIACCTLQAH